MSVNPVYVYTQTLDVSTGTASFTPGFAGEITHVAVSGATGGTAGDVKVAGVQKATFTVTNGAGEVDLTGPTSASAAQSDSTGTAQDGRYGNPSSEAKRLGYQKQANETNVGYGNYIGAEVPNPVAVASFGAADQVTVDVTSATAGTAVVTYEKK